MSSEDRGSGTRDRDTVDMVTASLARKITVALVTAVKTVVTILAEAISPATRQPP